jgi:hypothetical protein
MAIIWKKIKAKIKTKWKCNELHLRSIQTLLGNG